MRPQEILGMIEEAAGTRMFEERKEKAKRTMDKKEKRVEEITSVRHLPYIHPTLLAPNKPNVALYCLASPRRDHA